MNIWPALLQSLTQGFRAEPQPNQLELRIGEVVRATLLEILDDHTALLQVKGQTLRAQIETPLPRGASFSLVVMGQLDNGQMEMKWIQPPNGSTSPISHPTVGTGLQQSNLSAAETPLSVERLVHNLGVKDTPLTRMIVNHLLNAGQSVTASLVKTIEPIVDQEIQTHLSQISSGSGKLSAEQIKSETEKIQRATIDLMVQMVKKEIPVLPATYRAMKTLWEGPPLQKILADMRVAGRGESAFAQPAPQQPTQPPSQSDGIFSGQETTGGEHAAAIRQRGPRLPDFSNVVLQLEQLGNVPAEERAEIVRAVVNRLGLSYEAHMERLLSTIQPDPLPPFDTLKTGLLSVLHGSGSGTGMLSELNPHAAEQALHHLVGQQLMHAAKDYGNLFAYQFVSLPVTVDRQTADAKVHLLTRKKNGKQLDPYNCFLYFHLAMPTLGQLGIQVHVVEKLVSLRFLFEQGINFDLQDSEWSVLRQGLSRAGYHLGTVRMDNVSHEAIGFDGMDPFSHLPIAVSSGNFDLKV